MEVILNIVGLIIGIVGFGVTIYGVWKTKGAAESAEAAAKGARDAIAQTEMIASFSSAITAMEEVKRLHRSEAWLILPDRYAYVRRLLTSIGSSNPDLEDDHLKQIQGAISQFSKLEESVEEYNATKTKEPSTHKLNKIVSAQVDKLDAVLNSLKSSIE